MVANESAGGSPVDAPETPARVLVVDDDVAMRSALTDALTSLGFLVVGVASERRPACSSPTGSRRRSS